MVLSIAAAFKEFFFKEKRAGTGMEEGGELLAD
jgi:hypothetical protein